MKRSTIYTLIFADFDFSDFHILYLQMALFAIAQDPDIFLTGINCHRWLPICEYKTTQKLKRIQYKDGLKRIQYKDGLKRIQYKDGLKRIQYKDGLNRKYLSPQATACL